MLTIMRHITKVLKPRELRMALLVLIDRSSDLIFENRQYASIISTQVAIKGIINASETHRTQVFHGIKIGNDTKMPANAFMMMPMI